MDNRVLALPFLKWAGGKSQLLKQISKLLPDRIEGTYFEPFLGSGALYFHLWSSGRLRGAAVLSDANRPLIEAWQGVKEDVAAVVSALEAHRHAHHRDPKKHFYKVRASTPRSRAARAARFIYLNKTCYNGLWRVNRAGAFNVPLGTYKNPSIFDEQRLMACSKALQSADLRVADYTDVLTEARVTGAVSYLDPPYLPLSSTANFTAYTADGFSAKDQVRLAWLCADLSGGIL